MTNPLVSMRVALALLLTLCSFSSHALVVVRMETVLGDIDIELYDEIAPLTVENFLEYVNEGAYDGTFIHRSVPGFIIQGGGHALDEGVPGHIPEKSPVPNEFNISNTRGTIAMAKLPGDPDSATSEWFFNLADNSANLDAQNGGFTVFGRVLGDGMDVVDAIAALQVIDAGSVYADLPVRNYSGGDLAEDHYVFITRVVVQKLHVTPELDFGEVGIGAGTELEVTVTNQNPSVVTLGEIAGVDVVEAPFSIVSDACSGKALAMDAGCVVRVRFEPTALGLAEESFNIPSDDVASPNLHVQLRGTGSLPLVTEPEGGLVMDDAAIGESVQDSVVLGNVGGTSATVTNLFLEGENAEEFFIAHGCALLLPAENCEILVTFTPASGGNKQATLVIETDLAGQERIELLVGGKGIDLTRPLLNISSSDIDFGEVSIGTQQTKFLFMSNDGGVDLVIDSMEITGPDADHFWIFNACPEVLTPGAACAETIYFNTPTAGAKTASLIILSNDPDTPSKEVKLSGSGRTALNRMEVEAPEGGKVILLSVPNSRLSAVEAVQDISLDGLPDGVEFKQGFYQFNLELPQGVAQSAVVIAFPSGEIPETYYKYGRTPDNATPHWYEFMWEDESQTGAIIDGNVVTLYFADGGRGDDDLTVNGVIADPGGPGYATVPASGGGSSGGGCSMRASPVSPGVTLDWGLVAFFISLLGLQVRTRSARRS